MKKIIILLLVLIVGVFAAYKYLYHEHRDIAKEEATFSVTVKQLLQEFTENETKANSKYLDQSIVVKGKITNVDTAAKTIVLDEKVFVLLNELTNVQSGAEVSVQGRLIGYDSLLEEIKLDQAQIK